MASTSDTEWVTDGDGAALWVDFPLIDAERTNTVKGLRGEGLVDLKDVNVFDVEASLLQDGRDGESRTNTHDIWWDYRRGG